MDKYRFQCVFWLFLFIITAQSGAVFNLYGIIGHSLIGYTVLAVTFRFVHAFPQSVSRDGEIAKECRAYPSHYYCDETTEYCDVVTRRCTPCVLLCEVQKGLRSQCEKHCAVYLRHQRKDSLTSETPSPAAQTPTPSFVNDDTVQNYVPSIILIVVVVVLAASLLLVIVAVIVFVTSRKSQKGLDNEVNQKFLQTDDHTDPQVIDNKLLPPVDGGISDDKETSPSVIIYDSKCDRISQKDTDFDCKLDNGQAASSANILPDLIGKITSSKHLEKSVMHSANSTTVLAPDSSKARDSSYVQVKHATTMNGDATADDSSLGKSLSRSSLPSVGLHSVKPIDPESWVDSVVGGNSKEGKDRTDSAEVSNTTAAKPENELGKDYVAEESYYPVESQSIPPKQEPKPYHQNKHIYELLRKIPWVEGYYSEGQSIQVYVDLLQLEADWASTQLQAETGQPAHKFHIVHSAQLT